MDHVNDTERKRKRFHEHHKVLLKRNVQHDRHRGENAVIGGKQKEIFSVRRGDPTMEIQYAETDHARMKKHAVKTLKMEKGI